MFLLQKKQGDSNFLEMMAMSITWIVVMVSCMYAYGQTHQNVWVYIKYVPIFVYYTSIKLDKVEILCSLKWLLSSIQRGWLLPSWNTSFVWFMDSLLSGFLPSLIDLSVNFTGSSYTIWPLNVEIYFFLCRCSPWVILNGL